MSEATLSWADFEKVQLVAGTVTRVETFPQARKPAYQIWVDFGPIGVRKSSGINRKTCSGARSLA